MQREWPRTEVRVWLLDLDALAPGERPAAGDPLADTALLSTDEVARAASLTVPTARRTYVATRAALRRVLGAALAVRADDLRFVYGAYGKPELSGHGDVGFSVSHCPGRTAIAVAFGCDIGIDVERVRDDDDLALTAEHALDPEAFREFLALAGAERTGAFFACWSRREAYAKALGRGLSLEPASYRMTLRPGEGARLLRASPEDREPQWTLRDLPVGPGYVGALAFAGPERPVAIATSLDDGSTPRL